MPDSHEEQLLSDLLSAIAREDARLDAAHLEARVIAAAEAKTPVTDSKGLYVKAAAIVMAVLVPGVMWMTREGPVQTTEVNIEAAEPAAVETPVNVEPPTRPSAQVRRARTHATLPTPTTPPTHSTPIAPVLSADDFVPLLPLTEQELTGSFQLVRVQMPRASLGTLRSPLERPDELVEADVLLGADGMARAIRVSTSGSVYPWRTR